MGLSILKESRLEKAWEIIVDFLTFIDYLRDNHRGDKKYVPVYQTICDY